MKRLHMILLLMIFLCLAVSGNAFSEQTPQTKKMSVETRNRFLTVKAEKVSLKELLREIAQKSGINILVLDGVADRSVSVDVENVPYFGISSLLDGMGIKNYGVGYERETGRQFVYVVNAGDELQALMKDKTVVKRANFSTGKNVTKVKGKELVVEADDAKGYSVSYIKDEIMLKFHRGVTGKEVDDILKKHNLVVSKDNTLAKVGFVKATISDGRSVKDVTRDLSKEYKLKVPEPNYIQTVLTVSDPLYESQWYVQDTKFDKAWDKLKSKRQVKVAVIDTGVQADHLDLSGKILKGYDFVNNRENTDDDNGHGTFVAGIISANANTIGIKGLYDFARIIPVKVIDANGAGTYEDAAKGIIFAADNGAQVINLSIGGYGFSYLLQDAVDYALEKGCIVVAAGGNDGIEKPVYPAAYPDVIGVAALDRDGKIWSGSNSGRHIKVSAPGVDIISTGLDGGFTYASGTSASAPMVAALAAILTVERNELSNSTLSRLIAQSANDLGEKGKDRIFGYGAISPVISLAQQIKPFHDVAISRIVLDNKKIHLGSNLYAQVVVMNKGTYQQEYVGIKVKVNDKLIDDSKLVLKDKLSVIVPYSISELDENIKITAEIFYKIDDQPSNNSKTISLQSIYDAENQVYILYKNMPFVHSWAAYQAYNLLPSGSQKTEMSSYLYGGATYDQLFGSNRVWPDQYSVPSSWSTDRKLGASLFEGTFEEDEDDYGITAFTGADSCLEHFWEPDSGYDYGMDTLAESGRNHSALYRAQDWWNKAISNYPNNQGLAYYYLGRVVHLLGDMAVPEHVHLDEHPGDGGNWLVQLGTNYDDFSSYEEFTKIFHKSITASGAIKEISSLPLTVPTGYAPSSYEPSLVRLFYNMAQYTQHFDSSDFGGSSTGYGGGTINMGISVATYGLGNMNQTYNAIAYLANNDRIDPDTTPTVIWQKCNIGCLSYSDYKTLHEGPATDPTDFIELARGYGQIGYSNGLWNAQNNTMDRLKVTYVYKGASKIDYITNPWDSGPYSNVPDRHVITQMSNLFPENIRYIGALYKLFWDKTHATVTPSAGSGGAISPSTAQSIELGKTTSFTVTPNSGYKISSVTGCSGTLSGSTYTTGTINGACTVTATFVVSTVTVNGSCGSANGGTFTAKPYYNLCNTGNASTVSGSGPWNWSCAGSNGGTTDYCSANIQMWSVTPSAGANGTISPNTVQTLPHGGNKQFTITPNSGYTANVGGSCGGSPASGTSQFIYTTNAVTGNCTVSATFSANPVNGVCGTANGGTYTAKPNYNLCSAGSASAVSGSGPWAWSCAGSNGGSADNCSANIQTLTVTPSVSAGGSISPNTAQSVNYGSSKSFTITPNSGYTATVGGTCGGSPTSGTSPFTYTTNTVTSNCTVSVTFTGMSITVTSPSTGNVLKKGIDSPITWTSANVTGNVKIDLKKAGTVYLPLAANDANDGSYPFVPLSTFPDGNDYSICIYALNGTASACSGNFTISDGTLPLVTDKMYWTSRTTDIYVWFNKDMNSSLFSGSTVSVVGSSSGTHSNTYSFDHTAKLLTINPAVDFSYSETVTVTIGTGVKDLNGNSPSAPYSFSFKIDSAPAPAATSITVTEYLSTSSTSASSSVTVSGTATYNTGTPVAAGTATITAGGNVWTAAVSNGSYSHAITAPALSDYVYVSVSDGTLISATAQSYLTITGGLGGAGYSLYRTTTTRDVQNYDPYEPTYETEFFRRSDYQVYVWLHLTDLYRAVRAKWEFYQPDGALYTTSTGDWTADPAGGYYAWWKLWGGIYIDGNLASYKPGRWTCKLYIDDGSGWQYQATESFTIGFEFTEHRMSKDVQTAEPYLPINETNTFYQTDTRAITWANVDNLFESIDVMWEFYEPSGAKVDTFYNTMQDPGIDYYYPSYRFWGWEWISGYSAANNTGDWRVDVSVKNPVGTYDKIYTDYFKILENPSVAPTTTLSNTPVQPYESSAVSINVSVTDNTLLKKVVLHWKDATQHDISLQDNIYSGSYSTAYSLGSSFAVNQQIEYWVEAWDTSGNRTESSHKTMTVLPESVTIPTTPTGSAYLKTSQSATYTTSGSATSLGHAVQYQFDWGDGTQSAWGSSSQAHSWTAQNTYYVKARARCQTHTNDVSPWSLITSVTIDSTSPDTAITNKPTAFSNSATAVFAFTSTESNSTFECRLDGGVYASCNGPKTYTTLAEGNHTFDVRSIDLAGNVDATPASYTWKVDTILPVVTAGVNQTRNATFTQTGTATDSSSMTYSWNKVSGTGNVTFGTPSALSTTISADTDGTYTLRLTATDAAANSAYSEITLVWWTPENGVCGTSHGQAFGVSPTDNLCSKGYSSAVSETTSWNWTCISNNGGSTASCAAQIIPDTFIIAKPSTPSKNSSPTFEFDATGANVTYQCRLDSGVYSACTKTTIFRTLPDGAHALEVKAQDSSGNIDPTPANYSWEVDATAPVISPTDPASNGFIHLGSIGYTLSENVTSGTVTFTRADGTDDALSPRVYAFTELDLIAGSHSIHNLSLQNGTVYSIAFDATDAAGNSATQVVVSNVTCDTTGAVVQITDPAGGSRTNTATVTYNLNEQIIGGTITFTRTGGTVDSGSPHSYTLVGNDLAQGGHTINTYLALVDGAVYTITLDNVIDQAGNYSNTTPVGNVTYDTTTVAITGVTPLAGTNFNTPHVTYSLSEDAQSGSITFTRSGGAEDSGSPHKYTLQSLDLINGLHVIGTGLPLQHNTIYTLSLSAIDKAGNPATTVSVANLIFISDRHVLTVSKAGTGTGTVTASPGTGFGINCGSSCSETYMHNVQVVLHASSDAGSILTGWSEPSCNGSDSCLVTMNNFMNVTAVFALASVDGVCGSANGTSVASPPLVGLCAVGTASGLTGSGPWSWTCAGSGGGADAPCTASRESSNGWTLLFEDDFNDNNLNTGRWTPHGTTVVETNGYLSIQENVTDTYSYVVTRFQPVLKIKVEMRHYMHPSNNYFHPSISFSYSGSNNTDEYIWGLQWMKSSYSPDYCGNSSAYDKILVRYLNSAKTTMLCDNTNLSSSANYNQWITSYITYDSGTGKVEYDLGGDETIDYTTTVPAADNHAIDSFLISGYGWNTGMYHNVDWIRVYSETPPAVNATCGSSNAGTFITAPSTGLCAPDTSVPLTPTASGWTWSCPGSGGGTPAACSATRAFGITSGAAANGSISPAGVTAVTPGSSQSYTITPNPGFAVAVLVVDGTLLPGATAYTFTNVTTDHYLNAYFEPAPPFTITAGAGANGSISSAGVTIVPSGDSKTYTINPNPGYKVAALVADGTILPGATAYTFANVTSDHYLNAYFAPINARSLSVTIGGDGSGTVNSNPAGIACSKGNLAGCSADFPHGETVNLSASADWKSNFSNWSVSCSGNGACAVSLTDNLAVTALFASNKQVKLSNATTTHDSLQDAYVAANDGETFLMQVYSFLENLSFSLPKSVKLKGGQNSNYDGTVGMTTIQGSLTVEQGSVEISDVAIW